MNEPARRDASVGRDLLLGFAVAGGLGLSVLPRNGAYALAALGWITAAMLAAVALFVRARRLASGGDPVPAFALWLAMVVLAVVGALDRGALMYASGPWLSGRTIRVFGALLLLSYAPFVLDARRAEPPWLPGARFSALLTVFALVGLDAIGSSPQPRIDAFTVQRAAAEALLAGRNPYQVVDVASTGEPSWGVARLPYGYPPTQLLLTLPAHLAGDVRYTMLVALVAAAVALRRLAAAAAPDAPSLVADAGWLSLVFWVRAPFVIEQAWTDPVPLALGLGMLVAHEAGAIALAAVLLGLALSAKQTMIWLLPLAWLLPRFAARHLLAAVGVAAATVLPFALWDVRALYRATVGLQAGLGVHPFGLTYANVLRRGFGVTVPGWVAFALAAGVVALALRRLPRTGRSFAVAATLTYLVFFATNSWAFANYYFFVAGLGAAAVALSVGRRL